MSSHWEFIFPTIFEWSCTWRLSAQCFDGHPAGQGGRPGAPLECYTIWGVLETILHQWMHFQCWLRFWKLPLKAALLCNFLMLCAGQYRPLFCVDTVLFLVPRLHQLNWGCYLFSMYYMSGWNASSCSVVTPDDNIRPSRKSSSLSLAMAECWHVTHKGHLPWYSAKDGDARGFQQANVSQYKSVIFSCVVSKVVSASCAGTYLWTGLGASSDCTELLKVSLVC